MGAEARGDLGACHVGSMFLVFSISVCLLEASIGCVPHRIDVTGVICLFYFKLFIGGRHGDLGTRQLVSRRIDFTGVICLFYVNLIYLSGAGMGTWAQGILG